ncbi:MAG TPA: hypothetical protein VNZ49_15345 [Bacteroidia bacterium]|jgi:tetratricopeptide (TPR) repeat protein|nr:hypothetical protein [Bacteroidia bacterium]
MEIDINTLLSSSNDNDDPQVAFNMGEFLIQQGLFKEAKEKFDRTLSLKPDFLLALTARAQCFIVLKNFQSALDDCNTALKLGDDPFFVNVLIGGVYTQMGDIDKAIEQLDIALKIKHDDETYFQRGILKLNTGDDNGIDDIKIAAENGHKAALDTLNKLFPQRGADEPELTDTEIIHGYRKLSKENNLPPTEKTLDNDILKIYKTIHKHFSDIARTRNEKLSTGQINFIAYKFLQVFETMGEKMGIEHLKYELDKYKTAGLRDEYNAEIKIETIDWL